jgi:hypothetical protein
MDPLVIMDYAEDLNPWIVLLGIFMFFSAFAVQAKLLSNFIGVEFSILETLLFMGYGASTALGGFLHGEAEYLEYFVDISAAVGLLLFFGGSLAETLISQGLWFKVSVIAFFFLSIPSTGAVWYTRESVYEAQKYSTRGRF